MKKKLESDGPDIISSSVFKILRVMKLMMVLICFIGLLSSFGKSYSQNTKLSVEFKNSSIESVLNYIESSTEYSFMYDNKKIDISREINISAKDQTVEAILDQLFENEVNYRIIGKHIIITPKEEQLSISSEQQQKSVSGKVTDSTGAPLPGVSVVVKGTTTGVITDMDGKYTIIKVPDNKMLKFSFVGMKMQEIAVGDKTEINVVLKEEAIGIDEVVAIGYGTVKKQNITNSISKITNETVESRPISTLSEAFAGQLAGVRAQNSTGIPGAELQIRIRGLNTINGSADPLYVVDGIARDNMTDINPSDIASIQVLKDASATAIYGSRGANGIILIETKQGKGKPSFNFESYYGLQEATKTMDMMNADEWLAYAIYAKNVAYLLVGGSMKSPMASRPTAYQIPDAWYDYAKNGTDWQNAIFTTAPIQNYELSASAKNDLGSIYISGGYLDQGGIINSTGYTRMNFRFNGVLNVSNRIKIGMTVAPSYSNKEDRASQGKELALHHALSQVPLVSINSATRDWGFPTGFATVYPNPLEQLKETTSNTKLSTINTSVWGQLEIMNGLSFKSQYGYDHRNNVFEYFQPGNVTYANGNISIGNSNSGVWDDWSIQNTLVFDKTFKEHTLNVMIGQSAESHKYFNISANATGWPNDNVTTLNVAKTPTVASTSKTGNNLTSYFGRASYSYKDKYLLNSSMRYDGSSRFGSNNKWGLFPSASVGWKINKEYFLSDAQWINLLKIRMAWGKAGNDRIGDYDYLAKLTTDNTSWGNAIISGLAPSNIENPDLKWESTATTDIGIDFTGFNNRIQANIDYYKNKTDNLLFNVPIPNTTGFSSFRTNLGSVQNEGWELELTTHNTTGNIKWTTSVNFSHEKNKVLNMGNVTQFISSNYDGQFITRVGGPVSQFYVYRSNGLLKVSDFDSNKKALVPIFVGQQVGNTKYIDQNSDGQMTALDLVPYGNNIPDLIYGMSNTVQWKNLEFSVLFQGQIGGDVMFLGQRQLDSGVGAIVNQMSHWIHSWKPDYEAIYGLGENPIPNIEGVDMSWDGKTANAVSGNNNNNSDQRIYDGTFFRVKNITLSYNLPKNILNRTMLKSSTIYTSIDNLITFENYPGYTSETNSFGNGTTQAGVDYVTYPLSRKYTLGIKITF